VLDYGCSTPKEIAGVTVSIGNENVVPKDDRCRDALVALPGKFDPHLFDESLNVSRHAIKLTPKGETAAEGLGDGARGHAHHWRATPQDFVPFFSKPVSSTMSTPLVSSPRCSMT